MLLTVSEVAKRLGVTPDRVRDLERSQKLKAAEKTASGMRLFDPKVVDKLARERWERQRIAEATQPK